MSTSDIEMDAGDRQKFARGGIFLFVGGIIVVAFGVAGIEASATLYAGLVGASLALAVAAVSSGEPVVRAVWFAPGVAAVGVALSGVFPGGKLGAGGLLVLLGVVQILTAGLLSDR